ncbi:hypothetical protein Ancab_021322 [Ancistrocladus abbreviatus]
MPPTPTVPSIPSQQPVVPGPCLNTKPNRKMDEIVYSSRSNRSDKENKKPKNNGIATRPTVPHPIPVEPPPPPPAKNSGSSVVGSSWWKDLMKANQEPMGFEGWLQREFKKMIGNGIQDSWWWTFYKNGIYMVKQAADLLDREKDSEIIEGYGLIWAKYMLGNLRTFAWRWWLD